MCQPFLSIVTRCSKGRESLLSRNKHSVHCQTDPDLEHILIPDAGKTLLQANSSFETITHKIQGQYVFILDDDDYISYTHFVEELKQFTRLKNYPHVIICKMARLGTLYPQDRFWQKPPAKCHIGSPCFIVKKMTWKAHIPKFAKPSCGDFHFINHLYLSGYDFTWWNTVVAKVDHIGGKDRTHAKKPTN